MDDIPITALSREQFRSFNKVMEVLGDPGDYEDSVSTVKVIDALRHWYLNRQQELRRKE